MSRSQNTSSRRGPKTLGDSAGCRPDPTVRTGIAAAVEDLQSMLETNDPDRAIEKFMPKIFDGKGWNER